MLFSPDKLSFDLVGKFIVKVDSEMVPGADSFLS